MKKITKSIVLQILYYEIIICARGHGVIPIAFFIFILSDVPTGDKDLVVGLLISELTAILSMVAIPFFSSERLRLILFSIATISFISGLVFLFVFNGVETLFISVLSGVPFYYMTFRIFKNLSSSTHNP